MTNVVDFTARRTARRLQTAPQRMADFEIHAWMGSGEVEWVYVVGDYLNNEPDHEVRTLALIDAVWMYSADAPIDGVQPNDRPAIWWLLSNSGHNTVIYPKSIAEGTNFRHALWLLRHWTLLTRRVAAICWRMARSKS